MNIVLTILTIHFIADFIFQSRAMGLNKGKSVKWLSLHVLAYTFATTVGWLVFSPEISTIGYIVCWTFMSHWLTDFITSKASGYCYKKMQEAKFYKEDYEAHLRMEGRYSDEIRAMLVTKRDKQEEKEHGWQYWFWSVIGFDQFIHTMTLIMTYNYLIKAI